MNVLPTALQFAATVELVRRLLPGASRTAPVEPSGSSGNISVVIPARDEQSVVARCVSSVISQPGVVEVIVVDDESTDDTTDLARRAGATVVAGRPLPAGWVGKPWALQQGLEQARGDMVVCLDADTIAQPGLIGALIDQLRSTDVASLAPRFITSSTLEQALHASMLTTLIYRFGAPGGAVEPERCIANGQCMAFRRTWFVEQGGFGLAGGNMTDDIALVRALAARGARVAFLDGRNVVDVQMHTSVVGVWREWGRSLPMADVTSPLDRALDLGLLWFTLMMPAVNVSTGRATKLDYAQLLVRLALSPAVAQSYAKPRTGVYLSPLLDRVALLRLTQATVRPVRRWKGRTYETTSMRRRSGGR
jgi:dolichol-phosphate mannosyltransferase